MPAGHTNYACETASIRMPPAFPWSTAVFGPTRHVVRCPADEVFRSTRNEQDLSVCRSVLFNLAPAVVRDWVRSGAAIGIVWQPIILGAVAR